MVLMPRKSILVCMAFRLGQLLRLKRYVATGFAVAE